MIYITIDDPYVSAIPSERIEQAANAALAHQQAAPDSDLSVVFTGDAEVQELNRQYLDHDAPTDVLSFPAGEIDPENGRLYLGDILISVPQATRQAESGGHSLLEEVEVLVVHGVLHLLGHDHAEEEEKARMWQAQKEILAGQNNRLADTF